MIPNAWGATDWLWPCSVLLLIGIGLVAWSYVRSRASGRLGLLLGLLKTTALLLLTLCLLEPVTRFERPEKGANMMIVMADDSQSLQIKDQGQTETREAKLKDRLTDSNQWLGKLADNFDVRRYLFDRRLRPVSSFEGFTADQRGSDILNNLSVVANRFSGRPAAGMIVLTDGNATNVEPSDRIDWESMPPIYPVIVGKTRPAKDIAITRLNSSQTNFESAPVTITAEMLAHGYQGKSVTVQLLDATGKELEKKEVRRVEDGKPFAVRFQTRPEKRGVNFFQVKAFADGEQERNTTAESSREATIVNNRRLAVVDRGRGPFRILYVTGRPNWELKFLRRSLSDDHELDLVALIRIAKREAKFTFRGRDGQQSNSLFRGFESQDEDTTEQHDEPVFLRLGVRDQEELRDGFPKDAESLFEYDAIVLDDLESNFFTEDQKSLIQKFVSLRGGGFLMLGGQESFTSGNYDRTQVGELLPIYLDKLKPKARDAYQLTLTREGWLQPWVRIEATEAKEKRRLSEMPTFKTVNLTESIKPGATVLATVNTREEREHPALVVQPFGKGRAAAMLIGDLWRWQLQSKAENQDLFKAWRQMMRWLVADVPRRVEVETEPMHDANRTRQIKIRVQDESYQPLDNASVGIQVETPDGKTIELTAEATDDAGVYRSTYASNQAGAYKVLVNVVDADGSEIENRESGWVSEPDSEEFQSLKPNRKLLEELAEKSGGEVIELDELDSFVASLDHKKVPIMETRTLPWWHRWTVFWIAISLLVSEWGIRRWKGLP